VKKLHISRSRNSFSSIDGGVQIAASRINFCRPETVLNLSSNEFVASENPQTSKRSELYCSENLHREASIKLSRIV